MFEDEAECISCGRADLGKYKDDQQLCKGTDIISFHMCKCYVSGILFELICIEVADV